MAGRLIIKRPANDVYTTGVNRLGIYFAIIYFDEVVLDYSL